MAKGGKWGYIDKTGRLLVALKYERTYPFQSGLGAVRLNGKVG